MSKSYPRWKYHAINPPALVQSEAEETALGYGWAESPDEADAVAMIPDPEPPAPEPPVRPKFPIRQKRGN